jgi:hypothetical protein
VQKVREKAKAIFGRPHSAAVEKPVGENALASMQAPKEEASPVARAVFAAKKRADAHHASSPELIARDAKKEAELAQFLKEQAEQEKRQRGIAQAMAEVQKNDLQSALVKLKTTIPLARNERGEAIYINQRGKLELYGPKDSLIGKLLTHRSYDEFRREYDASPLPKKGADIESIRNQQDMDTILRQFPGLDATSITKAIEGWLAHP